MGQIVPLLPAVEAGVDTIAAQHRPDELALNGSGVGTWDWDLVTGKSSYSQIHNRLLGFDAAEDLGGTFAELSARVHPDDATEMKALVERHLRGETALYRAEFRVRRKDGSYTWFESRGVVVERGLRGEPLRMVGIQLDISDRKANEQLRRELETALRRNQEELEALVRLQTSKLLATADAAEQGNRAKNVLLATVGMELRDPLAVVIDSCARMLDEAKDEHPGPMREQLQIIRQSSLRLAESVERLLDVSRIESNTLEICATSVNLRHVLEEQCEAMQAHARERGLDLRTVSCDEDLVVYADRARLAQVVRELLTNAIKFTDRGYVQVRARVVEGAMVLTEVQDTGAGIPQDRQATPFLAFWPAGDQPRVLRRGTGLGLSICRAVIEAMAGSIGVTSKTGRGSRVWFTLPLAASAQTVHPTRQ